MQPTDTGYRIFFQFNRADDPVSGAIEEVVQSVDLLFKVCFADAPAVWVKAYGTQPAGAYFFIWSMEGPHKYQHLMTLINCKILNQFIQCEIGSEVRAPFLAAAL